MNFSFLFRFAFKELFHYRKLTFFIIVNLTISLVSFILINSFKESLATYVNNNSKSILTGDLSIYSRRPFTDLEKVVIDELAEDKKAFAYSYFSMVLIENNSQLINLSTISKNYPLYGDIEVVDFQGRSVPFDKVREEMQANKIVLINEEIKVAFDLKNEKKIKIGQDTYLIKYVVVKDIGGGINFNQISKKIYLAYQQHDKSIFKTKGNLVRRNVFIKLDVEDDLEQVQKDLSQRLTDLDQDLNPLNVNTHLQSRGQVGRILGNVSKFLSLISIVALFLSGVGAFYLFRNFIFSKTKEIAILESLGMVKRKLYVINILELIIIALLSVCLSLLVALALFPLIPMILGELLPSDLSLLINLKALGLVVLIAIVAILFYCFPVLYLLKFIKPIFLINENVRPNNYSKISFYLTFLPSIFCFYFLSIYVSESFYLGSIFSLSFLGIILFIILIQSLVFELLNRLKNFLPLNFNLMIKQFSKNKEAISFYFFSISLAVLLIALTPQLEYSLKQELAKPKNLKLPSLFLFNIQDFEEKSLVETIEKSNYQLKDISPMIFAQITHLNGKEVVKQKKLDISNESMQERNYFQRRVNLSYREILSESEKIVRGKPFSVTYREDEVIEISLEENYADRLGFKIGDEISFQLINIPFNFTGKVINLRKVKWNSFQPNFFILVHPQILQGIPKQLVASISDVKGKAKVHLQNKIVNQFPNISIVDVEKAINIIFSIIDKMNLLIRSMVVFCLLLGFFILFSIINYEVKLKEKEINLLKILSVGFYQVYKMVVQQYLFLGLFSISVGLFGSVIISYFLLEWIFDFDFYLASSTLISLFIIMNSMVLIISYLGAKKVLKQKPILLLKSV